MPEKADRRNSMREQGEQNGDHGRLAKDCTGILKYVKPWQARDLPVFSPSKILDDSLHEWGDPKKAYHA